MTETPPRTIKEEWLRRQAADHALDARLKALEAPVVTTPPVTPPPPPPVIVPIRKVVPFAGNGAQFAALLADDTVDEIALAGIYPGFHAYARADRSRPLLVSHAPGTEWRGDGSGTGALYLGVNAGAPGYPSSPTTNISFTPGLILRNYGINETGVVCTGWVENIALPGFVLREITALGTATTSHGLYVSSDGTHRSKAIAAPDWDIELAGRTVSGLHLYHMPNVDGLVVPGWHVKGCNRAAYLWGDASGVVLDGWDISDCAVTIDAAYETTTGVVRNCRAVGSGPLAKGKGYWPTTSKVADGGGNVAA